MKKNYRKIPTFILAKLKSISSSKIIVASVFDVNSKSVSDGKFAHIGLKKASKGFKISFMPPITAGKYSERNSEGREIIRDDLPRVRKSIHMGERPIYGDWSNGSFDLVVTRLVRQREQEAPRNISLNTEIIDETLINNETIYTVKVQVNGSLDTKSTSFNTDLLYFINLLQENTGKVDVFPENASLNELIGNIQVSWEILPIGESDTLFSHLSKSYRKVPADLLDKIIEKQKFFDSLKPKNYVYGLGGTRRYFGAQFNDNLVAFENLDYGNAIYILSNEWRANSQLSRVELRKKKGNDIVIVEHRDGWQAKVKKIIEEKNAI